MNESIVEKLGFSGYKQYLKSKLWMEIRIRVLDEKGGVCRCGRLATEVHHEKYTQDNLSGLSLDYMHPICKACHKELHSIWKKSRILSQIGKSKRLTESQIRNAGKHKQQTAKTSKRKSFNAWERNRKRIEKADTNKPKLTFQEIRERNERLKQNGETNETRSNTNENRV